MFVVVSSSQSAAGAVVVVFVALLVFAYFYTASAVSAVVSVAVVDGIQCGEGLSTAHLEVVAIVVATVVIFAYIDCVFDEVLDR